MKSRISIDLDEDNSPIIKIEYCGSEDVRDKMVKRFLEGFGGGSLIARFEYTWNSVQNWNECGAQIKPIKQDDPMNVAVFDVYHGIGQGSVGSDGGSAL